MKNPKHLILKAPHPSPLSAYRGFFGCKHFSKANEFLKENGILEKLEELVRLGAQIQVSSGAVLGEHGLAAKMFTRKLLKKHMVDFIGSDAHDLKDRVPNLDACATYVEKRFGAEYAKEIFVNNPNCILA